MAADGSGGAPVITALTTFDVSERRRTVVVVRDSASGAGVGAEMASALRGAAVTAAAILGSTAILDDREGDTTVNAS